MAAVDLAAQVELELPRKSARRFGRHNRLRWGSVPAGVASTQWYGQRGSLQRHPLVLKTLGCDAGHGQVTISVPVTAGIEPSHSAGHIMPEHQASLPAFISSFTHFAFTRSATPVRFRLPVRAGENQETDYTAGQADKSSAVYTKPWVVEFLVDAAGYYLEADLVGAIAVEPTAGHRAFLAAMALRLVASCHRQGRPLTDCLPSLLAFEINRANADRTRLTVTSALVDAGVSRLQAERLACQWVRTSDYLLASSPAAMFPCLPAIS